MDKRKTTVVKTAIVKKSGLAEILRQICRSVQDEAFENMPLPDNSRDRMIAINTMHNIFDRLDEALEKQFRGSSETIPVITEGDGHE